MNAEDPCLFFIHQDQRKAQGSFAYSWILIYKRTHTNARLIIERARFIGTADVTVTGQSYCLVRLTMVQHH